MDHYDPFLAVFVLPAAGGISGLFFVESGVAEVDVGGVHLLLAQADTFAKALEVNNLPLTQETDHIVYIWVIGQPQNIVIGKSSFLFWCNLKSTTLGPKMAKNDVKLCPRCGQSSAGGVPASFAARPGLYSGRWRITGQEPASDPGCARFRMDWMDFSNFSVGCMGLCSLKVPVDFNGNVFGSRDALPNSDVVNEEFHDFPCQVF